MIDDRTAIRDDLHPYVGEFIWTQANNYFGLAFAVGQGAGLSRRLALCGGRARDGCVGLAANLHFCRRS